MFSLTAFPNHRRENRIIYLKGLKKDAPECESQKSHGAWGHDVGEKCVEKNETLCKVLLNSMAKLLNVIIHSEILRCWGKYNISRKFKTVLHFVRNLLLMSHD